MSAGSKLAGERRLSFTGLYDLCLALSAGRKVVGNDFNADQKSMFMITGETRAANPPSCAASVLPS